jgi:DNA helicase HerA-like ATPase
MQIKTGLDYFELKNNRKVPVVLDSKKLINGHILFLGSSGVGKSHNIREYVRQVQASGQKIIMHVFDVHGDLHIPGASVVQFSEQATFGLNPLVINADPDFGGVHKCIRSFIRVINQSSVTKLGVQQEDCLRNLLLDVFEDFGFLADDASTWAINEYGSRLVSGGANNRIYLEVPIADKDAAKAFGARWDPEKKLWWTHTENYKGEISKWKAAFKARTYPTIKDVAEYAKELYEQRFLGSDQRSVRALGYMNKVAQSHQKILLSTLKDKRLGYTDDSADDKLDSAKLKAIEAFSEYVNSVRTGRELDTLLKYQNPDVVRSTHIRLKNLLATGIFKPTLPPFDPDNSVWRYKLNAVESEEKKMLVLFKLQELFSKAMQRGEQDDVVEIVVLDELGMYTSSADNDKGEGVIGVIAREARKFGLAMWAATQTPTSVPESLISSVATKVILGLDEKYWNAAVSSLRIDTKLLSWIQAHHTIGVQMKEKGSMKNRWWWVQLEKS